MNYGILTLWQSKPSCMLVVGFSTAKHTWLPVNSNHWYLNLAFQKACARSHYQTYKRLVQLRSLPTIAHGDFSAHAVSDWMLVFTRYVPKNKYVCKLVEQILEIKNIVKYIKSGSIRIARLYWKNGSQNNVQMHKCILNARMKGTRRRLRNRWLNEAKKDVQRIGVQKSRKNATWDRDECRRITVLEAQRSNIWPLAL